MKKSHIILIIVLAVAVGAVISLVKDPRTYGTFTEAAQNPDKSFEISGTLDKSSPVVYDALVNPDAFSFFMFDQDNTRHKVVVSKPKPQDFEKSIKVVVGGKMKGNVFEANHILLKCPSKYEGEGPAQIKIKEGHAE